MPGFKSQEHEVVIDKLVHGGQGIGTLRGGKKALVWNVLPGEKVRFTTRKSNSSLVEGIAIEILQPSKERQTPRDELYLSTSPWQMMSYKAENNAKKEILAETLQRAHVEYESEVKFVSPKEQWHYRNKMEYSFFGDEQGLHLALFNRGTHHKQIVKGSSIARPEIDDAANRLCAVLSGADIRAGDIKSAVIRCDEKGNTAIALFTRNQNFPVLDELEGLCQGIAVCFSNPKSPASVRTQDLYKYGDISLCDTLLVKPIKYDVFSFFQGNLEVFRSALSEIQSSVGQDPVIDLYSGVGSIGLSLPYTDLLIESEAANVVWAKKNTGNPRTATVIHASSERALEYIDEKHTLIIDPPRAGLHRDLTERINSVKPPKVIYLSCNPSTFARDLQMLEAEYRVQSITGYNFFPRTPHIEVLAILAARS